MPVCENCALHQTMSSDAIDAFCDTCKIGDERQVFCIAVKNGQLYTTVAFTTDQEVKARSFVNRKCGESMETVPLRWDAKQRAYGRFQPDTKKN